MGRVKNLMAEAIGHNRRSRVIRTVHNAAAFFESAYSNDGSNLSSNGEYHLLKALRSCQFGTIIDVGANRGDWLEMAVATWPKCEFHAFEVASATYEQLSARMSRSCSNARLHLNCCGLSDVPGTREMYYFPEHPEVTCDMRRHDSYRAVPFDAVLVTGDEYANKSGIESIDFLKIDVEGAEHKVLRGFKDALSRRGIQCIQFEYGAFSIQTRFLLADYYSLLGDGYWIGKIFPTYVEFKEYDWTDESFRFANYCSVVKSRPDIRALLEG